MKTRLFRIHGDNIVECERTLAMISQAFNSPYTLNESPVYFPKYTIQARDCIFNIELLSGHGRWGGINLGNIIHKAGGKLRESADSYVTEIIGQYEFVLLAVEYCSALPAGNNAWQRNGRALASVLANIPYLYYAEIGGIELDENRLPKAPRYPNPAVPFSYISLSYDMDSVCLPVYMPHPTMTTENKEIYKDVLGYADALVYIKKLIEQQTTSSVENILANKALKLVEILSANRRFKDTLRANEWNDLLIAKNRSEYIASFDGFNWKKKSSGKVAVSTTFHLLKEKVESLSAKPITAKDLPFCIISKSNLNNLKAWIKKVYNGIDADFPTNKDLALVWITGFKPQGEDSRPDRGLSPLCRMLLGKNANIMAVLSGPGSSHTWATLLDNPSALCDNNGLFQAIFTCCNYLFVDSTTCANYIFMHTNAVLSKNTNNISFPYTERPAVTFSEHDTDCAIHQILSHHSELGINECFCNPPGGDWSGILYFAGKKEYKWTSLPRMSKSSKRPDHIFQIEKNGKLYFVPIESKGFGDDLENNIGNRLKDYINALFQCEPTAFRNSKKGEWSLFNGTLDMVNYDLVSVGAFLFKNETELKTHLTRGKLDAIIAFEFGEVSTLHFISNNKGAILLNYLKLIASEQGTFVVKIHSF